MLFVLTIRSVAVVKLSTRMLKVEECAVHSLPPTYSTFPAGTENQTHNLQDKNLTLYCPTKKHHTALCEYRKYNPIFCVSNSFQKLLKKRFFCNKNDLYCGAYSCVLLAIIACCTVFIAYGQNNVDTYSHNIVSEMY